MPHSPGDLVLVAMGLVRLDGTHQWNADLAVKKSSCKARAPRSTASKRNTHPLRLTLVLQVLDKKLGDAGRVGLVSLSEASEEREDAKRSVRSWVTALIFRVALRGSTPKAKGLGGEVKPTGSTSSGLPPTPGLPSLDRQLPQLRSTNLHFFHEGVQFQTLVTGDFKKVPNWSKEANNGIVERYDWLRHSSEVVVVKIIPSGKVESCRDSEPNDLVAFLRSLSTPEDALGEIGVNTILAASPHQCSYVLKMLGVFSEPVLHKTWLVLENCDCDLFDFVQEQTQPLGEHRARRYTLQLLEAVKHLHDHNMGHRDVSLENLLLKKGKDELRLMDFGQAVQLYGKDSEALSYFRIAGKAPYRAPECYLPSAKLISEWGGVASITTNELKFRMQVPMSCTPGKIMQVVLSALGPDPVNLRFPSSAVPGKMDTAELCGYTVPPVDVWSCGVVFYILISQSPPWKRARLGDENFAFSRRVGVNGMLNHRKKFISASGAALLEGMLTTNPEGRWSVQQCLASSFFED